MELRLDQRRRSSRRGRSSGRRRPLCVPRHSCRSSARVHANGGENGQKGRSADLTHVTLSSPTLLLRIPLALLLRIPAFFMTTAYRQQPTELGVHCPWSHSNAKPFRDGRRRARAKSISVDFATGRRPGFDWATPLVRPHAFHWESLNIFLLRTATVHKPGIHKQRAQSAARSFTRENSIIHQA